MTNARVVALRPALEVGAGAGAERSRMRPQQPVRVPGAAAGAPGGGRLFREIVSRAVKAGLLSKRAVQVMDSSPLLGAAAVQDTYKLIRTALHKLVKGHRRELPAELMPRLKRYLQTGKADIDWEDREARRRELQQLVADAELALKALPVDTDKPAASAARELLERVAGQDVEPDGKGGV